MSYYDLYSYLPFLLSTTTTKSTNNKSKTVNYPTTPYQNANNLSSNSLSKHDKKYGRRTTTAARYTNKYNCTSANYQQHRSIATPSIHTQITIKTSNTTVNYLNSTNNSNDNTVNFMNNTPNYFFNRPLEEQLLQRPEIDESSLSSKSSCTTHSSFQVRSLFYLGMELF